MSQSRRQGWPLRAEAQSMSRCPGRLVRARTSDRRVGCSRRCSHTCTRRRSTERQQPLDFVQRTGGEISPKGGLGTDRSSHDRQQGHPLDLLVEQDLPPGHHEDRLLREPYDLHTTSPGGQYGWYQMSKSLISSEHVTWDDYWDGSKTEGAGWYQCLAGERYIAHQYGTPAAAWQHEKQYGWY